MMVMDTTVIASGAASLIALLLIWSLKTKSSRLPLPPGPRRIPFFGNIFAVDFVYPYLTYTQWGHKYGLSSNLFNILKTFKIIFHA